LVPRLVRGHLDLIVCLKSVWYSALFVVLIRHKRSRKQEIYVGKRLL